MRSQEVLLCWQITPPPIFFLILKMQFLKYRLLILTDKSSIGGPSPNERVGGDTNGVLYFSSIGFL